MSEPEGLLDIEAAARFLNVSETSLRRWTNSGRLACLRVGRRRERRFRREDLLAFMEEQPAAQGPGIRRSKSVEPSLAMIDGLPLPHGSHLCGLYGSNQGQRKQAIGFLADGLRPGSVCLLVCSSESRDGIVAGLKESRPALRRDIAAGRLVFSEYATSGEAQLQYWETQLLAAAASGAQSMRVVGDIRGLSRKVSLQEVIEYEAAYEERIARRFPVVTLCQYDVRQFSGGALLNVLKGHRDAFRYPADRLLA